MSAPLEVALVTSFASTYTLIELPLLASNSNDVNCSVFSDLTEAPLDAFIFLMFSVVK